MGSRREAVAGLQAEADGLMQPPITRGPAKIEFYDAHGTPFDAKTPPSPPQGARWSFDAEIVSVSILKQVRSTFPNQLSGEEQYVHVLLDATYLTADDYAALMAALMKEASPVELARIIRVQIALRQAGAAKTIEVS